VSNKARFNAPSGIVIWASTFPFILAKYKDRVLQDVEVRSAGFVRKRRGIYFMYVVSSHMLTQGHTKFFSKP
jgi:hypothetical protein